MMTINNCDTCGYDMTLVRPGKYQCDNPVCNITTIREIKKALAITDKDIARAFGYSNVLSYRNSSGKPKIEKGIEELYKLITKCLNKNEGGIQ